MDKYLPGTLYVVSTPIGNLGDITVRAIDILKNVDFVAAEDTRHSRKLFTRYEISTPLISYYSAKEDVKVKEVIEILARGKQVALISDAGTPGISDPGYQLIKRAIKDRYKVITIPGPVALISALTLSGLPTARFVFEGFLPVKMGARKKRLENLKAEERTVIIYESPRRTSRTLNEIIQIFGDRDAVMARELTKIYEEVVRGKLSEISKKLVEKPARGEVTLIISGNAEKDMINEKDMEETIVNILKNGNSVKDSAAVAAEILGISKREAYHEILRLKRARQDEPVINT